MLACLNPCDSYYDENISTLQYAAKAGSISNMPTRNEDPRNLLIEELKKQNKVLSEELKKANQTIQLMSFLQQSQPMGITESTFSTFNK